MTQNKSVEEVVEELRKRGCSQIPSVIWDDENNCDFEIYEWLRETLQQERQTSQEREREIVERATKFVSNYKEKYRGCGMADSMLALDEMLEAILTNPNKD